MIAPSSPGSIPLRRRIPGGVVDSGLSSAATFVVGIAAIRYLPTADAGLYALTFTAFLFVSGVAGMLIFTPAEILAVKLQSAELDRLGVLAKSVPIGTWVAAASAFTIGVPLVALPSLASFPHRLIFAATLMTAIVSPVQDHIRRVLHQAGASWTAALVAAVQLASVTAVTSTLVLLGLANQPWVPFTTLAVANVFSAAVGLRYATRHQFLDRLLPIQITLRECAKMGGWLVPGSALGFLSGFIIVAAVSAGSGAGAAAQAEATRLLAQPVTVVIVGLLAIIEPQMITMAVSQRRSAVHRLAWRFLSGVALLAVIWIAIVGSRYSWNPASILLPRAYEVPYLAGVMIIGQSVTYAANGLRQIPLAFGRGRALMAIDLLSVAAGVSAALLSLHRGAWGIVLAVLIGGLVTLIGAAVIMQYALRSEVGASQTPSATASAVTRRGDSTVPTVRQEDVASD